MRTNRTILFLFVLLAGLSNGLSQGADLISPKQREDELAKARLLLAPLIFAASPDDLISPFAPPGFDQPDDEELLAMQAVSLGGATARPLGPREILESLSSKIVPSGIARLGGEAILIFGQKKLKVGDRLTITYEDANYDLDITAIGSTTFTLRYKDEEITRSFKPGKQP